VIRGTFLVLCHDAAHAQAQPSCGLEDGVPWGTLEASRLYRPTRHDDDVRPLPAKTWFFVPPVVPVLEGQSGNGWTSLGWVDGGDSAGLCLYRGLGSSGNSRSCTNNGNEYRLLACAAVHRSGIELLTAGELFSATDFRLRVENGDRCATTRASLPLLYVPDVDGDGEPDCEGPPADREPPTWPPMSALVVSQVGEGARLVWTPAVDDVAVAGYRVLRDGTVQAQVGPVTLTHDVTGLAPGTTYTFEIQAFDAAGNLSVDGPLATFRYDGLAPTWPAGSRLQTIPTGVDSARLTWTAATDDVGVMSYLVFRDGLPLEAMRLGFFFMRVGRATRVPPASRRSAVGDRGLRDRR
jgi:hypothetical protein